MPVPAAEYVVTNSTGVSFPIALTKSVALLYSYFLGRNADGVRQGSAALLTVVPAAAGSFLIGACLRKVVFSPC